MRRSGVREDVKGEDMCKGGGVRLSGVRMWKVRICARVARGVRGSGVRV